MPTTPHDRIALVTGAGRGIGRATAQSLPDDGWCVAFSGRRAEALAESVVQSGDPFGDIGHRALAVPCDVTQAGSASAILAAVQQRFERLRG